MKMLFIALLFPMLSSFISEREAFGTNRNIPNTPSKEQYEVCKYIAITHFDPLRRKVGSPLYVSSMYRSVSLNKAVGGAKNSDHMVLKDSKGFYSVAIDIDQDGRNAKIENRALFFFIRDNFTFKTLIWEFDNPPKKGQSIKAFPQPMWIHVSWSTDPEKNKLKKAYKAVRVGRKIVYQNF